jgi:hypothetical protein
VGAERDVQNRDELEALAADPEAEAVASFSGPEDAGIFLIRAVEDPGPAYRRVAELP